MNKVTIVGRLGRPPELTQTKGGTSVANFSVATTERRKTKDGNWEKFAEWHRVVSFGTAAENHARYLDKGSAVAVTGRLQTDKYEKDGQTHYSTKIVAEEVEFLSPAKAAGAQGFEQPVGQDDIAPDDIPF